MKLASLFYYFATVVFRGFLSDTHTSVLQIVFIYLVFSIKPELRKSEIAQNCQVITLFPMFHSSMRSVFQTLVKTNNYF